MGEMEIVQRRKEGVRRRVSITGQISSRKLGSVSRACLRLAAASKNSPGRLPLFGTITLKLLTACSSLWAPLSKVTSGRGRLPLPVEALSISLGCLAVRV